MVTDTDCFNAARHGRDLKGAPNMLRLLHGVFLWQESAEERLEDIRTLLDVYFEEVEKG